MTTTKATSTLQFAGSPLQFFPMVAVAIALCAGIVAGCELCPALPFAAWIGAAVVLIAAACVARRRASLATAFILLATVAVGGMRSSSIPAAHYITPPNQRMAHIRQHVAHRIDTLLTDSVDEGGRAVVMAMTLGDKRDISRDLRADYSASGAAHVLALSGMHISMVFGVMSWLPRRRRWHGAARIVSESVLLAALWCYVLIVGMPPSAVRAATMMTLYELMALQGRDKMSLNVLAFTATAMLIASPALLYDVGFQLSFAAVSAILLLYQPLSELVGEPSNRIIRWVWQLTCVSFAAQLGTAPLVAYYFGSLPFYFLLTNLIVICGAYVIIIGAIVTVILLFCPVMAAIPARIITHVAGWMNHSVSHIAALPGASVSGITMNRPQVVLIYMALLCLCLMAKRLATRRKR